MRDETSSSTSPTSVDYERERTFLINRLRRDRKYLSIEDCEDIAQDVQVKHFELVSEGAVDANDQQELLRVFDGIRQRHKREIFRRDKREIPFPDDEYFCFPISSHSVSPEAKVVRDIALSSNLERLSATQQAIINLLFDGYTDSAIAELLCIQPVTVRVQLCRARKKLAAMDES